MIVALMFALSLHGPGQPASAHAHFHCHVDHEGLRESSGLARVGETFYSINDSDNAAEIFAISPDCTRVSAIPVQIEARDWETLSQFSLDGRDYLLLADIGDNLAEHDSVFLHIFALPLEANAKPAWSIEYRYPGGARDAESLFVDEAAERIYVLSKREYPQNLYSLPLRASGEMEATDHGAVHLPRPSEAHLRIPKRRYAYALHPTDMAIDPSGSQLAILTYTELLIYTRGPGQDWAQTLNTPPLRLRLPRIEQAEGVHFAEGGNVFVSSEKWPTVILRVPLPSSMPAPAPGGE